MATIKVVGDAIVITSTLKLEDILSVQKYRPSALILKGGEDGKEPIFAIMANPGANGTLTKFGATFGSASHDDNKFATITGGLPNTEGLDVKEFIADQYGAALNSLGKLEASIPGVLAEVRQERNAVMQNITLC